MDRKLMAIGILAVIVAMVLMSGCTSGPSPTPAANATPKANATLKVSPLPSVTPINKTAAMTNVSSGVVTGNNATMAIVSPTVTPIPKMSNVTVTPRPANNTTAK